jgi:hypothetical protein
MRGLEPGEKERGNPSPKKKERAETESDQDFGNPVAHA